MIALPRGPAHDHNIPAHEFDTVGGSAALWSANSKHRGIAEADRDNGRIDGQLIIINMRSHFRAFAVPIYEASFRQVRPVGCLLPELNQQIWQRGPRRARLGVCCFIAVAPRLIRHPTQRAEIRHNNRERRARFRHGRLVKGRGLRRCLHAGNQLGLLRWRKI